MLGGCCNTDGDCDDALVCTSDSCDTATHLCRHTTMANCCEADAGDCDAGTDAGEDVVDVVDVPRDTGPDVMDSGVVVDAGHDAGGERAPEAGLESDNQPRGCGCAVPGRTGHGSLLAPALAALAAAFAIRRRRR
jgi:MYXO-CTERM domain-containing protein